MQTMDLGDRARITATFTPGPPAEYEVVLRYPDGTEVELTEDITVEDTTLVILTPVLTQWGTHTVRVIGTLGAVGGQERSFTVRRSKLTTPLP